MYRTRKSGFVVIIAVALLALLPMAFLMLSAGTKTLLFESATAHWQAQSRNIAASAAAWAKLNLKKIENQPPDSKTELDISLLNIEGAGCTIKISRPDPSRTEIQIHTRYLKTGRTIKHTFHCNPTADGKASDLPAHIKKQLSKKA